MRIWEVTLSVIGAIKINGSANFDTVKELHLGNVFRSNVSISNVKQGIQIKSTVYTGNQDRAYKVALLFIGKMLDVLTIKLNTPLVVVQNHIKHNLGANEVKAVVSNQEFREAFELSRDLNLNEPAYLKGINWFRKGLYTNDPFDKFLAFWNAISVVAGKYHNKNERTQRGAINQIWDCFVTLWGDDCNSWEIIQGDDRWINNNNGIRDNIAHGGFPVEIEYVEDVISKLEDVQKVAKKFLVEWGENQLGKRIL